VIVLFLAHRPDQQQQPQRSRKPLEPLIDARNILRPETVESLFIAFHLSGDEIYRQWGWQIFQAFLRTTRLPDQQGFASIRDVNAHPGDIQHEDRMET
jgi:endoplasmic reticulum Man9GlcNAc2 1,2-alpha-mannosidase